MPGQIVHIEIPADDTAKGQEFWGSLFGWQFQSFPGPSEYQHDPDQRRAGRRDHEHGARQARMRAYFDVDDIKAGAARVKELGGEAGDPMPVPTMGWFATCTDPHGNEFGLWQTTPCRISAHTSPAIVFPSGLPTTTPTCTTF